MWFGGGDNLRTALVELLSERSGLDVHTLDIGVTRNYRSCSVQAIYKELRALQALGVVVKAKDRYSLSLSWIANSLHRFQSIYSTYVEDSSFETLLPERQKKSVWFFSDLYRTDDFWIHVALALFEKTGEKSLYSWIPRPWFELVHHEEDVRYQKALREAGRTLWIMVGGCSPLEQHYAAEWPPDVYRWSMAEGPFADRPSQYINVIGDYIFWFEIDEETTKELDQIFETTPSPDKLDAGKIIALSNRQIRVKAVLEHSPQKAKRFYKQFSNYFGVC